MNKYLIRFNKSRGQPGRGTELHVWRVFENDIEYLAKDVIINAPSWTELSGGDWSIACRGVMQFTVGADLAVIYSEDKNVV